MMTSHSLVEKNYRYSTHSNKLKLGNQFWSITVITGCSHEFNFDVSDTVFAKMATA